MTPTWLAGGSQLAFLVRPGWPALVLLLLGGAAVWRRRPRIARIVGWLGVLLGSALLYEHLVALVSLRPRYGEPGTGGSWGEAMLALFQHAYVPMVAVPVRACMTLLAGVLVLRWVRLRRASPIAGTDAEGDPVRPAAGRVGAHGLAWTALAVALAAILIAIPSLIVAVAHRELGRRDDADAATLEAVEVAQQLAGRIAACAERGVPASLPADSRFVPATAPRGVAYRSADADWSDEAFRCAGFRLPRPQRFQLRWARSAPTCAGWESQGEVWADADLDGDGRIDRTVTASVACGSGMCTVSPDVEIGSSR